MSTIRTMMMAAALLSLAASVLPAQADFRRDSVRILSGRMRGGAEAERVREEENGPGRWLFPPDLVLGCRRDIGLTLEQREAVRSAVREMQAKTLDLQWKLQDESEKLVDALKQPAVREADALIQIDRVLGAERDVKRAQMAMLIRVKNVLTADQQRALQAGRDRIPGGPGDRTCDRR